MKWIKITSKNLPDTEVLIANFKPGTYGYQEKILGYISYNQDQNRYDGENENEILENATHFIDLTPFDID